MSPSLYLLYGTDDVSIEEALQALLAHLGDAATIDMNSVRFIGPPLDLNDIQAAAFAAPFLAKRRMVIVENTSKSFTTSESRKPLFDLFDQLPATTGLVLLEKNDLGEDNRNKKKDHWLLAKMKSAGDQAFIKRYSLPQGGAMLAHLQKKTQHLGGELEGPAAAALAEMIGQDTRAAIKEIEKLLAYVNYSRPITLQDVEDCALEIGEHGDYFGLMDALSSGPGPQAINHLRQLQAERDPISLFFGMVGQFRGLLQAREIVDQGGGKEQLAKRIGMHPFRAQKLIAQCRKFDLATLEGIYQKLNDYDRQIKKGLIQPQLAMDFIVAAMSA